MLHAYLKHWSWKSHLSGELHVEYIESDEIYFWVYTNQEDIFTDCLELSTDDAFWRRLRLMSSILLMISSVDNLFGCLLWSLATT